VGCALAAPFGGTVKTNIIIIKPTTITTPLFLKVKFKKKIGK
jgi:hypothetical protein